MKIEDAPQNSHLSSRELGVLFENYCDSDFQKLRSFCSSINEWQYAVAMLESNGGAGWKFLFKLLLKGRLYDSNKQEKINISCRKLLKEFKAFFEDA